ncbi:unnamed protein product [marine sediment metagenome]|uniref:Uncharacterized protein n=1 Tax=marine sediment metagenome TaxID=412755 RepID=X1LVB9_9ZZZZ
MPIVQFHLKRSHEQLRLATSNLQDALRIAKLRGYGANYIAAINKALIDSQAVCLHVGNITTLILQRDESDPLTPSEKEN